MLNNNDEVTPTQFYLSQNYPNPFNEKTTVKYCVAYKTRVQISVYSTEGEEIEKLVDEEKNPGTYEVEFSVSTSHSIESKNLDQGYYFYRMKAGDYSSDKKWLCINKLSGRLNMKSFLQFLFFFLLATQICFGQWEWQNPHPQGNNLSDVFFVNASTGWAAGDVGTILKTTNGGGNWTIETSGINDNISDICFIDANIGWAVSGNDNIWNPDAIIIKTTDGGIDWLKHSSGISGSLYSVCFIDVNIGWTVGGDLDSLNNIYERILKTTDGGQNWFTQTSGSATLWSGVSFTDENNGWIVGSGSKIFRTTDGGNHWTAQTSGTNAILNDVYFTSSNIGWVVGDNGTVLHTTNGGSNWYQQNNGVFNSELLQIYFIDENIGWVVGKHWSGTVDEGLAFLTTNGGNNWSSQTFETTEFLSSIYFTDANTGWIVGDGGTILKSTNAGNNWVSQTSGLKTNLTDVEFVNANKGWAVGDSGQIFYTIDAGFTWLAQQSGTNFSLNAIAFTDEINGWIVGGKSEWPYSESSVLLNTSNGGATWYSQTGNIGDWYSDICFIDSNTGTIVGGNVDSLGGLHPNLLRTTNGGVDWIQLSCDSLEGSLLKRVCFVDENNGWIAADFSPLAYGHCVLLRTTDGGFNWSVIFDAGWMRPINGLHFINSNVGIIVGGYNRIPGFIAVTTNGGQSWMEKEIFFETAQNVQLVDLNVGIVVCDRGRILKTIDSGENWIEQTRCTNQSLKSVYFVNELDGWAVGSNGTILHTTNGGVSFIEGKQIDEIPTEFLLSQNFPNPFNPSTKIKYSVLQSSNVIIKVFDILGNEIETLINEEKPIGTYELTWYAENLPSGVYFYQLKAGEVIQTKKMILIK